MVRDGDDLVAVREHAAGVEVLDPPAAEQRDPSHAPLALDAGERHALDEHPLREEEQDDDGQHEQHDMRPS